MNISYEAAMERLLRVVQEISLARTLDALTAIVRQAARELTGADGATFVLREGDHCHYADEDAISPLWKGQRFPMTQCISGWVMIHRKPSCIEDVFRDPRIPADVYRPTFVKSLAMVPIRTQDPIGAIGNYWARKHRPSVEEVKLLQALADTVSVAMENLRLYQKLEKSHRLFNTFMANAPLGAAIRDSQGRYAFANARMARLFGESPEGMLGRTLADVFPAERKPDAARLEAEDAQVLATRDLATRTVVMPDEANGDRHLFLTKFPIVGDFGDVQLGVVALDITERVEAERKREETQAKLQAAYKFAALGEMAGGIAHEINNPLSIVIGKGRQLREVLEAEPWETDLALEFADAITAMADRILGIVNGLTTISRGAERDPFVTVDWGGIVDGTVALVAAKFRHAAVRLDVADEGKGVRIACRPTEISQVLMNLLSNALDATMGLEDKWVRVGITREDGWTTLAVTDSGAGIPFTLRQKIMQPFFTTKDFGKGTGLGLSISKGIVENHGGSLTIDETSRHTRFLVRLPCH